MGLFDAIPPNKPKKNDVPKNGTGLFGAPKKQPKAQEIKKRGRHIKEFENTQKRYSKLPTSIKKLLGEKFVNSALGEVGPMISTLKNGSGNAVVLEREIRKRFQLLEKKFDEKVLIIAKGGKVVVKKEAPKKPAPVTQTTQPKPKPSGSFSPKGFGKTNPPSNTNSSTPKKGVKENITSIFTAKETTPILEKLYTYHEYLKVKGNATTEPGKSIGVFIEEMYKSISQDPSISIHAEEIEAELDKIFTSYATDGKSLQALNNSFVEKFKKIQKNSQDARASLGSQLESTLRDESVAGAYEFFDPRKTIRREVERMKKLSFEEIAKEVKSGQLNLEYISVDSDDLDREIEQFIFKSDDAELVDFLKKNKQEIIAEFKKAEEIHEKLQKELTFLIQFIQENKEHLDPQTHQLLEKEVKGIIAYMMFINSLHDQGVISLAIWGVSHLDRLSVIGYINDGLSRIFDDYAIWGSTAIIAGILFARLRKEKMNRASFLRSINKNTESTASSTDGEESKTKQKNIKKGGVSSYVTGLVSASELKSMELDDIYELFALDKETKRNPLRTRFKEQFNNIEKLREVIQIFERMGGYDTELEQLRSLKNTSVWGNKKTFSREILKTMYGFNVGKRNFLKKWIVRFMSIGSIEGARDLWGAKVTGDFYNIPTLEKNTSEGKIKGGVKGTANAGINGMNFLLNMLSPNGHGIDTYGKGDATTILKLFIEQNKEVVKETTILDKWLKKQAESKNPSVSGKKATELKYTLQEITSEMMDESYNQAKVIVDNILIDGNAITDLKAREDRIQKIETIIDRNKWFGERRVLGILKEIGTFATLTSPNKGRVITFKRDGSKLTLKHVEGLLTVGSKYFKLLGERIKIVGGDGISTTEIQKLILGELDRRTGLSLSGKLKDIFNPAGSGIDKDSEEAEKLQKEAQKRRATIGKTLEDIDKFFEGKIIPDVSGAFDEDMEDIEKTAKQIKKIKKNPVYDSLPSELKNEVTKVLKASAKKISDGKYGYDGILDEVDKELESMEKTLGKYSNLPEETKADIRKHMKNSIGKKELGDNTIFRIEKFNELFLKVVGDEELTPFLAQAFKDDDNIDAGRLQKLAQFYDDIKDLKEIAPVTKHINGTDIEISPRKSVSEQKEELRQKLLAGKTPAPRAETGTTSKTKPTGGEELPKRTVAPERKTKKSELTPEQKETQKYHHDLIERAQKEISLQKPSWDFNTRDIKGEVTSMIKSGSTNAEIEDFIKQKMKKDGVEISSIRSNAELTLELAKKVDGVNLGTSSDSIDLDSLRDTFKGGGAIKSKDSDSFWKGVLEKIKTGEVKIKL